MGGASACFSCQFFTFPWFLSCSIKAGSVDFSLILRFRFKNDNNEEESILFWKKVAKSTILW
jgi:hypothetical protein